MSQSMCWVFSIEWNWCCLHVLWTRKEHRTQNNRLFARPRVVCVKWKKVRHNYPTARVYFPHCIGAVGVTFSSLVSLVASNKWQIFVYHHLVITTWVYDKTTAIRQNGIQCEDTRHDEAKMCQAKFSMWWRGLWQASREHNAPYRFERCRVTEMMLRPIEFT